MITSLAPPRFFRIVAFSVGAVAVAVGAVWVTASAAGYNTALSRPQSNQGAASLSQKTGTPSAVCSDFVSHFTSDLGVTQGKLNAAFQKAIGETLADEVKKGDLTQSQADAIKKKIAGKAPCALIPTNFTKVPGTKSGARLKSYEQWLFGAAASALGITDQELKTDLANGMTLSQIAAAHNVTEAQFRAKVIASVTPLLDKAVAGNQLTSAQRDAILKALQTAPIPFWNTPMRVGNTPVPSAPKSTSSTTNT